MKTKQEILQDYFENGQGLNIQSDVLPIIFRDDEIQKMIDVGFDSVSLNEYQFGMLGEKFYEKVIEAIEETGLRLRYQLWKFWREKYGFQRALDYNFKKHPAIESICVFDEPINSEFDAVKEIIINLELTHPDLYVSTNLYPCYVPESVIGSTYEEHIDKFFKEVLTYQKNRYVSCDYYPFMQFEGGRKAMMDTWLYNHFLFAKYCKEYNTKLEWCIQTCNYKDHRVVEKEDVVMQFLVCMAFGIKTIECFCYGTPLLNPDFPEGCEAIIGANFQPTSMYYATQSAIKEIRKIEKVCTAFEWEGLKTFIGKNNKQGKRKDFEMIEGELESFKEIDDIECSEDTFITEMYDEKNSRYGYMIINFNDPYLNIEDQVEFNLKDGKSAIILMEDKQIEADGKTTITLTKGAGAFIVIK